MAEVQRHIDKRGKRNTVSRRFRKKGDDEAIASWRSDLNKILHVFKVRSVNVIFACLLRNLRFQTELEVNTDVTKTGAPHDATTTHTFGSGIHRDSQSTNVVPRVRKDVSDTPAITSGIHHNTLKSREHTDGRNPGVSVACTASVTE